MQQYIDSYDFAGKKAIVRVDFNVPLNENFEITDDTRIRRAIPTLKKVLEKGGALIIMSHLGRPKKVDPKFSLKHIVARVSECLGVPVQFAPDCQTADAQAAALKPGEALLLENLRFYAEELGNPAGQVFEGEFGINLLGASEMGHDDNRSAGGEDFLQSGHRPADTGVVRYVEILIERDVEINPYNGLLASEIVAVYELLHIS